VGAVLEGAERTAGRGSDAVAPRASA
jgi:hypothetical protein